MSEETVFDRERLRRIIAPLLAWYRQNARQLPWRASPSAYHVWVSEIMLQQTRVEAVRPYYTRFLEALPGIPDLAACPEEKLLKLWEGLGYYSRVRNMQRCARVLVERFGGELPADEGQLAALPGIGPYTAGAIASIAFGRPAPAVDGNVMRVISRLCASDADILLPATRSRIDAALRLAIGDGCDDPGAFNQAMMDLGAAVCLPGAGARCGVCPLEALCLAREKGLTQALPVRIVRTKRKTQKKTVLVIRDGKRTVLGKRADQGLLAGLYELPNLEGHLSAEAVLEALKEQGLSPLRIRKLPDAKHIFTHLIWEMTGYQILVEDLEEAALAPGVYHIVPTGRIGTDYAIPSAFKAYLPYLS